MCDDDAGTSLHGQIQRLLNSDFGFGVQMRSGLVENHDWRRFQQQTGDGQTLPLASGQPVAASPTTCPVRPELSTSVRSCEEASASHLVLASLRPCVGDSHEA